MDPLIVTLALDEAAFAVFDAARRAHFPPERNLIPAHLTLFHKLPGAEEEAIAAGLAEAAAARGPLPMTCAGLRFLGRGVAYRLEGEGVVALRRALARRFAPSLGPQDAQAIAPHVTIQNKVDPRAAKALLARLQAGFAPFPVTGEGLLLWRYRGGPWEPAGRFPFAGGA
ncbi:2'-5' RNA ligase family protein [Salinarimonas sp.]|uniref:2'-5' RNA ligase family protein n=1 Tax=Salinarimonas sp. TaxID=2766526 RepID=UPI0032D98729